MFGMIAFSVVMGLTLGFFVAKFWKDIVGFVQRIYEKLKTMVTGALEGFKIFLRKTSDGVLQIVKTYSQDKETQKWTETIVKKTVSEKEVPRNIKNRITMDEEFDATENFREEVLSVS